jgi:hypothetical protein
MVKLSILNVQSLDEGINCLINDIFNKLSIRIETFYGILFIIQNSIEYKMLRKAIFLYAYAAREDDSPLGIILYI